MGFEGVAVGLCLIFRIFVALSVVKTLTLEETTKHKTFAK